MRASGLRNRPEIGMAPPVRVAVGALLPVAAVFLQVVALGADGPLLAAAAAALDIAAAIAVVVLLEPDGAFWKSAAPALAPAAGAILWVMLAGIGIDALLPALAGHAKWPAPDMFGPGMTRMFGAFALFVAAAVVGYRRGMMRFAVGWLVILGGCHILLALSLRIYDPEHVWGVAKGFAGERFTGTFLNANASACVFGVTALLAMGWCQVLLREPGSAYRESPLSFRLGVYGLVVPAAVGACAITASRTGVALTVVGLLALVASDSPLRRRIIADKRAVAATLVIVLAVLAVLAFVGGITFARLGELQGDAIVRLKLWGHYGDLVGQAPLFGYGPISFSELNLRHLADAEEATAYWYINSPHNVLLSLLLVGGWPFALCLICAAVLIAAKIVGDHRRETEDDPLYRALWAALLLILGCAMVDIALDVPAISALGIVLLAMLWGRALRGRPTPPQTS